LTAQIAFWAWRMQSSIFFFGVKFRVDFVVHFRLFLGLFSTLIQQGQKLTA
jgi:hypothetical protein